MLTRMVLKPAEVPALNPKAAGQLLRLARPQPNQGCRVEMPGIPMVKGRPAALNPPNSSARAGVLEKPAPIDRLNAELDAALVLHAVDRPAVAGFQVRRLLPAREGLLDGVALRSRSGQIPGVRVRGVQQRLDDRLKLLEERIDNAGVLVVVQLCQAIQKLVCRGLQSGRNEQIGRGDI